MGTNLVVFTLRRVGASLLFAAEPAESGPQSFSMHSIQTQRMRHEGEVLKALDRAGVGYWSRFPADNVQATVTREQLRTMGFRGNY